MRRSASSDRKSSFSDSNKRRSASSDRKSLVPMRVRNDDNIDASSGSSRNGRSSIRKSNNPTGSKHSLYGNRMSIGGRPSVGGGRPSVGVNRAAVSRPNQRLSRGSGMGIRNNGVPKDPRPVSDKAYQHKCIKNIFQFLTDKGYPHNITTKMLQSPTNKDFFHVFEFMYCHIGQDYKTVRPEEDIPKIAKMLGYPFMISKSAMSAVGSPHMWPTILAFLNWLVELIEYSIMMSDQGPSILFPTDEDSFDSVSEKQIIHNYMVTTYKKYLNGDDDFPEDDEALRFTLKTKLEGAGGGVDDLLEENRILKLQLEHLEQDKDKLKTEGQNLQLLKLDEERLNVFMNELESHKRQLDQQKSEKERIWNELRTELEAEDAKFLKMQLILEKQEFSQEDVDRLKHERRELQRQKEDAERRVQSLDQNIWQKEIAMTKNMEQVDAKCQAYNDLAYKLKLIPLSAENSSGINFELKRSTFMDGETSNVIKNALLIMKRQCQDSCMKKEAEKAGLMERIEELTDVMSDLKNELALLESRNKRTAMEIENQKQVFQSEREKIQQSIEELENEKLAWNNESLFSGQDVEKEKKKLDKWRAMEQDKRTRKAQEHRIFFSKALEAFVEHIDTMQNHMANAKKIQECMVQKIQEQNKKGELLLEKAKKMENELRDSQKEKS